MDPQAGSRRRYPETPALAVDKVGAISAKPSCLPVRPKNVAGLKRSPSIMQHRGTLYTFRQDNDSREQARRMPAQGFVLRVLCQGAMSKPSFKAGMGVLMNFRATAVCDTIPHFKRAWEFETHCAGQHLKNWP